MYGNSKVAYINTSKNWIQYGKKNPIETLEMALSFIKEDKVFKAFIKKYLNQQEKEYSCMDDFKDFPIIHDIYCTGSDQTWNSGWNNGILPELFLKFVPDNVKKISYAASFAMDSMPDKYKDLVSSYLRNFDALSIGLVYYLELLHYL